MANGTQHLQRDSVHGPFEGTVEVDVERDLLIINGNVVQVIYAPGPDAIDYTAYGIEDAMVIDNTVNSTNTTHHTYTICETPHQAIANAVGKHSRAVAGAAQVRAAQIDRSSRRRGPRGSGRGGAPSAAQPVQRKRNADAHSCSGAPTAARQHPLAAQPRGITIGRF